VVIRDVNENREYGSCAYDIKEYRVSWISCFVGNVPYGSESEWDEAIKSYMEE